MKGRWLLTGVTLLGTGCAHLHQLQIADIDATQGTLQPFEVQVNATGVSVHDSAQVAKLFATSEHSKNNIDNAEQLIAMTQMGPKTGDPTFSDTWADGAAQQVLERCPTGRVTGVSARRETMDYPVISGEIVTIKGYCIQ